MPCRSANRPEACATVQRWVTEDRGLDRVQSTDYGARKRITEGCEPCKGARVTLRRGWTALGGRFGAAGWVSHSAPPFVRPAGLCGELGGGARSEDTEQRCKSARGLWKSAKVEAEEPKRPSMRGVEMTRRRRPKAESAGKPRGMGEWIFMARKACTPPFPTLNPNPSRSFLSAGRGDYPKGLLPLKCMSLDSKNIVCRCSVYFYGDKAQTNGLHSEHSQRLG
jgi:hypothetical protein